MHVRLIAQVLALVLGIVALGMAAPALLSWIWGETDAAAALGLGAGVTVLVGAGLLWIGGVRRRDETLLHREAFLVVTLAWLSAGFAAGLPLWLSGHFGGLSASMFEGFSGVTTTGATILTDIEAVPRGLLLWRSTTQWIGGGGIVLLGVAILPLLGVGGMELFRAEVSGPTAGKLQPRVRETARLLWRAYLVLTVAQILLLVVAGMGLYDAVNHAFTTVATGGFSTKSASIAAFDSPVIEGIIIVFMLLGATSFALHFAAVTRGPRVYWRDTEFRVYVALIVAAVTTVAAALWLNALYGVGGSIRYAAFQVVSIITTTGYATADYEAWRLVHALPAFTLFTLMLTGGCAGSTAGGIKIVRVWLLFKQSTQELFRQIHPRAVTQLKLGRKVVAPNVQRSLTAFIILYFFLFVLGSAALSLLGMDFVSATTAAVSALSNIGPALGSVGPHESYAHVPEAGQWILIAFMVVGRLEMYTVLVLLVPEYWRR
jgi:trk system potassium uptake protein